MRRLALPLLLVALAGCGPKPDPIRPGTTPATSPPTTPAAPKPTPTTGPAPVKPPDGPDAEKVLADVKLVLADIQKEETAAKADEAKALEAFKAAGKKVDEALAELEAETDPDKRKAKRLAVDGPTLQLSAKKKQAEAAQKKVTEVIERRNKVKFMVDDLEADIKAKVKIDPAKLSRVLSEAEKLRK